MKKRALMLLNTSLIKAPKSIAFIGGRDQLFVSRERLNGYIKALKEYELDVNEKLIAQVDEFTIVAWLRDD